MSGCFRVYAAMLGWIATAHETAEARVLEDGHESVALEARLLAAELDQRLRTIRWWSVSTSCARMSPIRSSI